MFQKCIVTGAALALVFLGVGFMTAQPKAGKSADREADKAAIDKLIKANVEAFNNRDAAALAANWTEEGEYVRNDGDPVRGRDAVQKGYARKEDRILFAVADTTKAILTFLEGAPVLSRKAGDWA